MPILYAIRKYKENNFKIEEIDKATSQIELDQKEKYWIKLLQSQRVSIGYNVRDGGNSHKTTLKSLIKSAHSRIQKQKRKGETPGAFFSKHKKRWKMILKWNKAHLEKGGFISPLDAQIARDLELIKIFNNKINRKLLIYPENHDKYLSGEISYPKIHKDRKTPKNKYRYVNFHPKHKWTAKIQHNNKIIKRAGFDSPIDAAIMADYIISVSNFDKPLNFPEDRGKYLAPSYRPPLTMVMKRRSVKHRYIYESHSGRYEVNIRILNIYKCFQSPCEAKAYRDDILTGRGIPLPD